MPERAWNAKREPHIPVVMESPAIRQVRFLRIPEAPAAENDGRPLI